MSVVYYKCCRFAAKVQKILNEESALGHRLKSAVMADMASRYDMFFEDTEKRYTYIHEYIRAGQKAAEIMNEWEEKGYRLVFLLMGDMVTRYELFFEKEIN